MDATVLLPPHVSSATTARRFTERNLSEWGLDGLVETAGLLVSELVINAVTHARTESRLVLHYEGRDLRVEVSDDSSALPYIPDDTPHAPSGRGMRIVASLSDRWGVDEGARGKTVWFELLPASSVPGP